MQRRRLTLAMAATLLMLVSPGIAGATEPYSVRGIALGGILADFKITPAPDRGRWPDARPVCSDDNPSLPLSDSAVHLIRRDAAEVKVGFVKCAFLHADDGKLVPAGPLIAGAVTEVSFLFVPDQKGALRLGLVSAEGDSDDYARVKGALLKRLGPPQTVVRGFAYDSAGAKLQDEVTRWSNGVSEVSVDQRLEHENVKHMGIDYRYDVLLDGAKKMLIAAGGDADQL